MHRRTRFDAILSFDLVATGGLAWRLGRYLQIPAAGWAFGGDVRDTGNSSFASAVRRSVNRLDLIFYQSRELVGEVARLLRVNPEQLDSGRHLVLSHGIEAPPTQPWVEIRQRVRAEWKVKDQQIVVLSVGRLLRSKGVFELLEAMSVAARQDPRLTLVLVGAIRGFDETEAVQRRILELPGLQDRVWIVPACDPSLVWEYLSAADLFAFASHREGMPNSLLEAMAMGVPAVSFDIPPVKEIDAGTGALTLVPSQDTSRLGEAIVRLASDPKERDRTGQLGRRQVFERFLVQRNMATALKRLSAMTSASRHQIAEGKCARSVD